MRPVRAIILGYGIRGRAYASYAATHPDEFEIAGLADPVAEFPQDASYPTPPCPLRQPSPVPPPSQASAPATP